MSVMPDSDVCLCWDTRARWQTREAFLGVRAPRGMLAKALGLQLCSGPGSRSGGSHSALKSACDKWMGWASKPEKNPA